MSKHINIILLTYASTRTYLKSNWLLSYLLKMVPIQQRKNSSRMYLAPSPHIWTHEYVIRDSGGFEVLSIFQVLLVIAAIVTVFSNWKNIFSKKNSSLVGSQSSALFRFSNTVVRRFYGLRKCGSFDRSVQASVLLPHLQIIISSGAKVKLKGCNGHLTKAAYFCGSWEKFAILNFYVDNNDWGINTK